MQELNRAVCSRFRVVDPVCYPLEKTQYTPFERREAVKQFLEKNCSKAVVFNMDSLIHDISELYRETHKSSYLKGIPHISAMMKTELGMVEPYATVFSHLLIFSHRFFETVGNVENITDSEKTQITNSTYICARYMREAFTEFVFNLIQLNLLLDIFPDQLVFFLTHYMTVLEKEYGRDLPKW